MRKLLAVFLVVGVIGGVAGCSAGTPTDPNLANAAWYDAGDGRAVWCLRAGTGISCDWKNARPNE